MGKVRIEFVNFLEENGHKVKSEKDEILWVTDFPLFECDADGKICSVHHPFTAPHPDDIHLLETNPLQVYK